MDPTVIIVPMNGSLNILSSKQPIICKLKY